jgi:hypothetical protein
MTNLLRLFVLITLLSATTTWADWPGSVPKWTQVNPDTWAGASFIDDVTGTAICADDFLCTSSLPIVDIHFGGFSTFVEPPEQFRVTFWSDVPKTLDDESHPGDVVQEIYVNPADLGDPLKLGWQQVGEYEYSINLPKEDWFYQQGSRANPIVYWIGIQGVMPFDGFEDDFYWLFRNRAEETWGDDAAFASDTFGIPPWNNWGWDEGMNPGSYDGLLPPDWIKSADMAFALTTLRVPEPGTLVPLGMGAAGLAFFGRRWRREER